MDTKNIQFLIEMLGKLDDNQAKAGTDIKAWREEMAAWKEKMDAKTEAIRRERVAIRAETKARREMRNASRKEAAAVIEPETKVKTMACHQMEAHQEEKKPTSPDRKPEAAQKTEVPAENATVMPVGEPKKKRRRDRKLAAEHHGQKPKTSTRENCGPQKRLAVARSWSSRRGKVTRHTKETDRKMTRRATAAPRKRDIMRKNLAQRPSGFPRKRLIIADKKIPRRATVARRTRDTLAPNMTRRAKVARRKENTVGRNRIRNNQTRNNVARGAPRGRRLQGGPEGRIGVKDEQTRRRLHPRNERTASNTLRKTLRLNIRQQTVKITSRSQPKNWTLWRGRPLQNEKRETARMGGTGGRNTGIPRESE
jgi:hypothetical protein